MIGHDFSRQFTEKFGTKYGNEKYILEHLKIKMGTIFWDGGSRTIYFLSSVSERPLAGSNINILFKMKSSCHDKSLH